MAGWLHLWRGEFRFDSEDPPLWNALAAMVTGPRSILIDPGELDWPNLPMDVGDEYRWQIQTLFRTIGNDPIAFIGRFRAVMLTIGLAMGGFLAYFVWQVARSCGATPTAAAIATVLATGLLALDPNFLAHSPLVKNDVFSTFALLGLIASTWSAGRILTHRSVLFLSVWSSIALIVKFNGPLLVGISAVLLLLRAISPWPWMIETWSTTPRLCVTRIKRLLAATAALSVMAIMSFAVIWFGYGLRFAPSRDPDSQMNMPGLTRATLVAVWEAKYGDGNERRSPTQAQVDEMSPPVIVQLVNWANHCKILPQSYLAGILYVFEASQARGTFLHGRSGNVGSWWYFPFAMAVKSPVATLAAFAAVMIAAAVGLLRRKSDSVAVPLVLQIEIWTALCLGTPPLIYLAVAMSSNLNLGIRHVLPVYPLLFAAAGLTLAKVGDWHRKTAIILGLIVVIGLAIESCCAFPNYIPFFNVLAGGRRGGLRLLSDSNLDWGQDLPLLASWQKKHPDLKLYLAYFGAADPAYYGIRYINLVDGYYFGPPAQPVNSPGVLAISATTLQGTYNQGRWSELWSLKPFEVLGGSIYLFHVPAKNDDHLPIGHSLIN